MPTEPPRPAPAPSLEAAAVASDVAQVETAHAPSAAEPSSSAPDLSTAARDQQFEILAQAVTALCDEIARNHTRSQELEEEQARLRARVEALRRDLSTSRDEDVRLRSKAEALEKQLREVGAAIPGPRVEPLERDREPAEAVLTPSATAARPSARSPTRSPASAKPAEGDGLYHVVAPGENLFRIGVAYGVDYRDLASANGIADPARIEVGQRIFIPHVAR